MISPFSGVGHAAILAARRQCQSNNEAGIETAANEAVCDNSGTPAQGPFPIFLFVIAFTSR